VPLIKSIISRDAIRVWSSSHSDLRSSQQLGEERKVVWVSHVRVGIEPLDQSIVCAPFHPFWFRGKVPLLRIEVADQARLDLSLASITAGGYPPEQHRPLDRTWQCPPWTRSWARSTRAISRLDSPHAKENLSRSTKSSSRNVGHEQPVRHSLLEILEHAGLASGHASARRSWSGFGCSTEPRSSPDKCAFLPRFLVG